MKMKGTLMNKTKMLCAHRTGGVRVNGAAKRAVLMLALAVSAASVAEARDFIVEGRDGAAIQRTIDAAAAAGGGRVVVPAGVYPSGSIRLRSKIDLHLEKGAVVRGADRPDGYDDVDDPRIGCQPESSVKVFLWCFDGEDVSITGDGVFDGQGVSFYDTDVPPDRFFRKPPHPRPRMVELFNCRNVRLDGNTYKDSPGWTMWIRKCENVVVKGVAIDGCQQMINNDGVDFDSCRHVRMSNCRFKTGDDCIALRAIVGADGAPSVCEDVVVKDCSFDSWCQGVRIGCPSDDTIRDVVFSNIVCKATCGILSFHPYHYLRKNSQGNIYTARLLFTDWTIDSKWAPIELKVEPGIRLRRLGGFTFRNIRIKKGSPNLAGTPESPVVDVVFDNVSSGDETTFNRPEKAWGSWETQY